MSRIRGWLGAIWYVVSGGLSRDMVGACASEVLEPGWKLDSRSFDWTLTGVFRGRTVTLVGLHSKNDPDSTDVFMECPVREASDDAPEGIASLPCFLGYHAYPDGGWLRILLTPKPHQVWSKRGLLLRLQVDLEGMTPQDLRRALTALSNAATRAA